MPYTCAGYAVCVGFRLSAVSENRSASIPKLNLAVPTVFDNPPRLAPQRPKSSFAFAQFVKLA